MKWMSPKENRFYEGWLKTLPNLSDKVVAITGTTTGTVIKYLIITWFYTFVSLGILGSCCGGKKECKNPHSSQQKLRKSEDCEK